MCSEVKLTCRHAEAAALSPDFERKHETYLRNFCLHRWLDMEMITVEFLFINLISNAASPYQKPPTQGYLFFIHVKSISIHHS